MGVYNLFVKEVPVNEWTAEGGTALEAIGKTTVEPGNPGTGSKLKVSTGNKKCAINFTIPEALKTLLEGGAPILAATLHVNGIQATAEKVALKYIWGARNGLFAALPTAQGWVDIAISSPGTLTLASFATNLELEHTITNSTTLFEAYMTIEVEEGSRESSEGLKLTESAARALGAPRTTSETLHLAESTTFQVGIGRATADTLALAESTARIAHSFREDAEEGRFQEFTERTTGTTRTGTDTVHLAESALAIHGNGREQTDTLALTEGVPVVVTHLQRNPLDPLSLAETVQRVASYARTTADVLVLTESDVVLVKVAEPIGTVTLTVEPHERYYLVRQRVRVLLEFLNELGGLYDPDPPTLTVTPLLASSFRVTVERESKGRYSSETFELSEPGRYWLLAEAPDNQSGGDSASAQLAIDVRRQKPH